MRMYLLRQPQAHRYTRSMSTRPLYFPPDDSGYGFDNNSDVLGVSPVLLERYLSAAGKISALAIGDPETGAAGQTFRIRQDALGPSAEC